MTTNQTHNGTTPSASTGEDGDTTETATESVEAANTGDEYRYRCPFCDASYEHELLARVHVTRADDAAHANYNGMMPEVEIERVNADDVVERIPGHPDDSDPEALTSDVFGDEISEQHKHILLVATYNPHESTYTTLADLVATRLDDTDIDVPSYSTVRRVIRQFYRPHREEESDTVDDESTRSGLSAYTAKQQAIIIARVLSPSAPATTIAAQVGCAKSYPSQVEETAEEIIDQLQSQVTDADDPAAVFRDTLTDDDIQELQARNLLADVPISFSVSESPDEGDTESDMEWGSPITDDKVMTATPDRLQQTTLEMDADQEAAELESEGTDAPVGDTASGGSAAQPSVDTPTDRSIPQSALEDLQEKVGFLRATLARTTEADVADHAAAAAVAEQIEEQCEAILQRYSQDAD